MCSNKTLFTQKVDGLDLAPGLQFANLWVYDPEVWEWDVSLLESFFRKSFCEAHFLLKSEIYMMSF